MANFYIESGTGAQVSDPTQLKATSTYTQSGTGKSGLGSSFYTAPTTSAAQAPVSPVPQISTPTVPNANPAQNQTLTTPTTPQATPTTPTQPNTTTSQSQAPLSMPATGSVVDLLTSAGQDSSFAARQQLAQQFGIQGYTGTAAQNQDLSKKYLDAFNANKGSKVPDNSAQATSALDTYFQDNQQQTQQDPTKNFMDVFASMNPVEANIYQQLSGLLSSTNNQQSLTDLYTQEAAAQGIPALNLQLADINNIMNGTEDDIRAEVQNAGGFATESQVQALTGARNKNLLKQASAISNILQAKNDYVDRIVSLTQADRAQVSKDLDQKLGIAQILVTMSNNMENAARDNIKTIVDSVGWEGLAKSVANNPTQAKKIESLFGMSPGELQSLGAYKKPLTPTEELQFQNVQLQNKKLQQDIASGPAVQTQVVDINGKKVLINSKTGAVISDISGNFAPDTGYQLASAQQTINNTSILAGDSTLNWAVGPTDFARRTPFSQVTTGARSNFLASAQQLSNQLTLTSLQNAKANGATFGALSEGELNLLSSSATKLNSWAVKDKAGNITGYNTTPEAFKAELDKINNFAKLDYVLKGGSPESAGLLQQADGTYWSKNSNGTYTQIK